MVLPLVDIECLIQVFCIAVNDLCGIVDAGSEIPRTGKIHDMMQDDSEVFFLRNPDNPFRAVVAARGSVKNLP